MPDFTTPTNQFFDVCITTIQRLLHMIDCKVLCEIGAWTGHSTSYLAARAKETDGKVHVIETFEGGGFLTEFIIKNKYSPKEVFLRNMAELKLLEYIVLLEGNSNDFHQQFEKESIDFMFVDGDHRYNQFSKDLDNWYPKIRKGGIFCGHDCEGKGFLEEYINIDWGGNDRHNGVIKAVFERFTPNIENGIWWIIK